MIKRHFEEIWNQGNLGLVDELLAANHVFHDPAAPGVSGHEAYKQLVTGYRIAYPDIHFAIEEIIAEGDKMLARWTGTGTHQGELMGIPPTGVKVTTPGFTIIRIAGGKIVEEWANWDTLGMMQQLGVITPGRPTPEDYAWGAPSEVTGDPGDPEA
ncbi:ester cyclase, partial [Candidatus Poribacteria bacterium]